MNNDSKQGKQAEQGAAATPTPWAYRVKQVIGGGRVIASTANVATGFNTGNNLEYAVEIDRTNKANAALIVKAVNSHAELVAALHKIHANAAESPEWIRAVIDAALAKAQA